MQRRSVVFPEPEGPTRQVTLLDGFGKRVVKLLVHRCTGGRSASSGCFGRYGGLGRCHGVSGFVLLAHVADELVHSPRLRHCGVIAMAVFDAEHSTNYAESLTTWFDEFGDVTKAAIRLGVHANTLRYRLRRISELFDISLVTTDDRLAVWLQLRLSKNVAQATS
jgi:hypothetical protein